MLFYLDGAYNNGNNPNENYARELYELFTLGEGNNYTEQDIIETARALSGYVERGEIGCTQVTFDATKHDAGSKTILGQTGNWGYDDVINILFPRAASSCAQPGCATQQPRSRSRTIPPAATRRGGQRHGATVRPKRVTGWPP